MIKQRKMSDKHTKILLIEDNPGYARLVQKMLAVSSQVECQIECADRLSTGLKYLAKGEYDVVLVDLGLPDSKGLDTLDKVYAQAPAVPIVVLTGIDDEALAVQAVRQGAQDYLVKGDIESKTLQRVMRYAVQRKWAERALKESEDRYRDLCENANELIQSVTPDGHFLYVNKMWRRMLGYSEEDIANLMLWDIIHPDYIPHCREVFQKVMSGETVNNIEAVFIAKDGKLITVEGNVSCRSEGGKPVATRGIFRDITERKKMEAQLIQAEKLSAVGTMAAGVAHELLNPMMGMLNFAQYCLKHTSESDPRYPVLQDIERETRRCANIVRNITTFSRTGKQDEEGYQEEGFATIIDRVVRLLSYRIEKERVSLIQHIDEEASEIWMEANDMQRVLLNLISNALDALTESQEKEIHVEVHREDDFIQLTVADSGCGIVPDNLEKIYDPFFTTKPVGQGTGLGLTTSRSIIDSHGGNITCESKLGVGTTFKILLPVEIKGGAK